MTFATFPHPIRTEWKILAELRKDNPGVPISDIAKQLGVNAATCRMWIRQPLYQSYENWFLRQTYEALPLAAKRTRAEVTDELDEFAQEMLVRLRDIVETSNDDKLIASIGFDVLDRAGYGAAKKDAARPINLILTPEVIAAIKQRQGEIVDGTVVVGQLEA